MVDIEEFEEAVVQEVLQSEERLMDAQAIEEAAALVTRPTAKMQLETLSKKLRKESEALKRVEASRAKFSQGDASEETVAAAPSPAVAVSAPVKPIAVAPLLPSVKFQQVDRFSFDAGKYKDSHVTVYVPLPAIGDLDKEKISCEFTSGSFDLIVKDLKGKSFRLFKDNLSHNIDPEKSKFTVKADKVVIKLGKLKGDYGYDSWSELSSKKKKLAGKGKDDPQQGIMDMMKDMYDNGDDKMKKMIGETMLKQRNGELGKDPDMGMGF
jgi:calcyclin binding protein